MDNGSEERSGGDRLSRGDRRRNAKLAALRGIVRRDHAIVAVDLASAKQAVVVADHDSVTLGRRMFACSPWGIAQMLDWAEPIAAKAGYAGVVLACEPTGHRWKPLVAEARRRGIAMVCVQPLLVHRAREGEDFTRDRSDFKDATLIGRLTAQLHCYVPQVSNQQWSRLRHLGVRRHQLLRAAGAARQQIRDLLECVWPAALAGAAQPLDSLSWRACMAVSCDPTVIAAMDYRRYERAVVAELGAARPCRRIIRAVHAAAAAPDGIDWERPGAVERAGFAVADWQRALAGITDVEDRMIAMLDVVGLAELIATVPGLSLVGAAAILAETGDPTGYNSARAWVKHAGLCPRDNESGRFTGQTAISGRGRPLLRTAAWRAVWAMVRHNPVYTARYAHLRTRERNRLNDGQARAALGAALLRQLHVICTTRVAWDPAKAGPAEQVTATAA